MRRSIVVQVHILKPPYQYIPKLFEYCHLDKLHSKENPQVLPSVFPRQGCSSSCLVPDATARLFGKALRRYAGVLLKLGDDITSNIFEATGVLIG